MRVRLDGPLAHYELQTWAEAGGLGGSQRLIIHELGDARSLLRRLVFDNPGASLRGLVSELDGGFGLGSGFGVGLDGEALIERLAQSVVRGRLIIERHPVGIRTSDALASYRPEALEEAPEFEGNEFEDECRVIQWVVPTPLPQVVLDSTHEAPPGVMLGVASEPPPVILIGSVAKPPPTTRIGSDHEPSPTLRLGSEREAPTTISLGSSQESPPQLAVGSELGG